MTKNDLLNLVKQVIREEYEKNDSNDEDSIASARTKGRKQRDSEWAEDALAHGITRKEIAKYKKEGKLDELISYLHSCNKD